MMSFRRLAAGALAVAFLAIPLAAMLFLTGCRRQEKVFVDSNLSPDTRLTSAPGPADDGGPGSSNYRIHLYWDGTDSDGFVVAYHFAWDDTVPLYGADNSPWRLTGNSDSLFRALIDTIGQTRRHTFYVRAVDNEGKLDPSPARVRFDAWTVVPEIDSLYRVDGPLDPGSPEYDPDAKDTVLMGTPAEFVWGGWDPDGLGAPIEYSFRLDSNPFSPYGSETTVTLPTISSGTHFFYVKAHDETGAENFPENYKFVMNYEPDSQILEPIEDSATLTVADKETIWFRWVCRDREQLEGQGGGLSQVLISLDNDFLKVFTVNDTTGEYPTEWYFTSNTGPSDEHYISSRNSPQGGNADHEFEVWARDVEGTFERPSDVPEDREIFKFWYNHPPTSEVLFPTAWETVVGTDFEILWDGVDVDGEITAFQFVLDPWANAYRVCQIGAGEECTSWLFEGVEPTGDPPLPEYHEFRVRAQDDAGCWEETWNIVKFYVEEAPTGK